MNRFWFVLSIGVCMLFYAGCDGWIENRAEMKQAPEYSALTPELLRGNMESTDYTAIVHIVKGRVEGRRFMRRPGGYVNHIYQARVIETVRGQRLEAILFSVMAESDIDPILPDYPVIVSLCVAQDGTFHVPDNGYMLPANASMTAAVRAFMRMKKKAPPRKSMVSVCGTGTDE